MIRWRLSVSVGVLGALTLTRPVFADVSTPATEAIEAKSKAEEATKTTVAIIGPVLVLSVGPKPELRKVESTDVAAVRAREIEATLKDTAQDLDLSLDLTGQIPGDGVSDLDLIKRAAAGVWVISPRLEVLGKDTFLLRIVAVPPKSATLLVRVEKVEGPQVSVRSVVMLKDFVSMKLGTGPTPTTADDAMPRPDDESGRSRGRPILAASTTLFGLYAALSIQKSSQSDDQRLLYPLLALGSGLGLGASLLAADEWNVTPGVAWTVAGGTWWGVIAGLNIAAGRNVQPTEDRYGWGFIGGLTGTSLAVTALALKRHDEGDAALVHSGAALGTFTGGLLEGIYCGDVKGCVRDSTKSTPSTGIGYGAAFGLVGGGVLAAFVDTSAQRVLFVDLGLGLGALAGASAASPLGFGDKTEKKQRGFLIAVGSGTLLGGALAYFLTRDKSTPSSQPPKPGAAVVRPNAGILGTSMDPKTGATAPIWGAGILGTF